MANTVSFIIELKNRFGKTARKVREEYKGIGKAAEETNRKVKKTASGLRQLKQEAKGVAGQLGAVAAAAATINVGAEFQDAIAELSAITGAEGANLKTLSEDIMRLSKNFGIAQSDVARAVTQVASAKSELLKDPKSLSVVTAEALRLSKAAGIELPEAVKASIGALNQWGVGADQAGKFVNVIAAGAKVGASQVGQTAEALKNAGTVAAQFGLTFEQTNAILQVFAKNEVKGAEAGTALRGTLSKLEKFAKGRFAPSKLGIIKSLQMIEKLGLSNAQIIKEFGEENLRSILILRKNIPLVQQWTNELTGTSVAQDQATTRMETFNQKLLKAGTSLKSIAIRIFEGIEPVLSGALDLFTFMINAIEGVSGALGELLGQIAGAISIMDFSKFDVGAIASKFGAAFGLEAIKLPPPSEIAGNALSSVKSFFGFGDKPAAPSGTVAGQILVKAAPGAIVEQTKMANTGNGLQIGLNMAN